jgi:hypothetical protein
MPMIETVRVNRKGRETHVRVYFIDDNQRKIAGRIFTPEDIDELQAWLEKFMGAQKPSPGQAPEGDLAT